MMNMCLKSKSELLKKSREPANIREAKSKRQMEKYHNTKVRNTSFKQRLGVPEQRSKPCRRHWKVRTQLISAAALPLPEKLSIVHSTFHVSKLKKCMADEPLAIPLDEIQVDDKLNFIEEPVEIMDREV
ncbi:hypothetical protein Tco_1216383 [Tanacetum coccineum]